MKDIYTTHELGRLCKVDNSTIKNWINEGKLPAYRTPGGHRRIKRDDLIKFLEKYGMPVPPQVTRGKPRVLIVDDNKEIVNLIIRVLKRQKWEIDIETAYDGYEAGTKVVNLVPDLIILDNELPGVNGLKILQDIKANDKFKGTKVIAITGKSVPETKEKFISAGADIFMPKPLEIEALSSAVAKLLNLQDIE